MEKFRKYPAPSTEKKLFKRNVFFFFFQSEVKGTKLEWWVVYLKGGEGGGWKVKQKAPEPTDVEASRPKTMLYLPDYITGFTIISVLLFLLYTKCLLRIASPRRPGPCSPWMKPNR